MWKQELGHYDCRWKAKIFIGQLNFKNAADVFQSVLDVSDQSSQRAWAYYGRGQALLELERTEEAAYLFEQAFNQNEKIDLAPTSLFKSADAYYQSDRFEKSSELYEKFLKIIPITIIVLELFINWD